MVIRRELIVIPQSKKDLKYYSYAYDKCQKNFGFIPIPNTKAPPPLIKRLLASPSTVSDVMTCKYVEGISLVWQEMIWARQCVERAGLPRITL